MPRPHTPSSPPRWFRDGPWFLVRVLPYRTLENVIDGVVITFTDATAAKMLESTLREQANQLKQMTEALPNLTCTDVNDLKQVADERKRAAERPSEREGTVHRSPLPSRGRHLDLLSASDGTRCLGERLEVMKRP